MLRVLAALALCACTSAPPPAVPAPPATKLAAIGETLTIDSNVLGQRRVINVYLPPDYAKSNARYPVLYMPDGGMAEDFPHVVGSVDVSTKNAIIRPVIVVGVENIERRHDLLGTTTVAEEKERAPHAGGADKFRAFFRDELKPMIAARYRTTSESAIIGESAAGLFVLDTFVLEPTLFDAYIAADPSVFWNEDAIVTAARQRLASYSAGPKQVFVTTANFRETQAGVEALGELIRIYAPEGVRWTYEPMPWEQHSTIFPTTALHGIRSVFGN